MPRKKRDDAPRRPVGHPTVNENAQRVYVELPGALLEQLRSHTQAHAQTLSAFVRLAIANELERQSR